MTKVLKTLLVCCALQVCYAGHAQTQRDSNNAEIKKQALEMRERVNKYMADKLMEQPATPNSGGTLNAATKSMIDSIANLIAAQQAILNSLQKEFKNFEQEVNKIIENSKKVNSGNPSTFVNKISDNILEIYFPFDGFQLTPYQIKALTNFINRNFRSLKIKSYTDKNGTEKHNDGLARRRANEVMRVINIAKTKVKCEYFINYNHNNIVNYDSHLYRKVVIILTK